MHFKLNNDITVKVCIQNTHTMFRPKLGDINEKKLAKFNKSINI